MSIKALLTQFSQAYKEEISGTYNGELRSFKLIVKDIPKLLSEIIDLANYPHLTIKGSIGKGNNSYYPWIGIFDERVSPGPQSGFYIVILFSDDFNDFYLTINQAATKPNRQDVNKIINFFVDKKLPISEFNHGQLPKNSLVRTRPYNPQNKGAKYEKTNLFYKHYDISNFTENVFIDDLRKLRDEYQNFVISYQTFQNPEIDIFIPHKENNDNQIEFSITSFLLSLKTSDLIFNEQFIQRFISLLITKPFVILTGLSGSGKTGLAHAFASWICENSNQYIIIPVGSDWTNREPLLGYPNALEPGKYIKPDTGALDILINARKNPEKPHFLILDEMNLSHVERYFADFLSVMETGKAISLYSAFDNGNKPDSLPEKFTLPSNLFIIGTVNIDETTYMFSPKVLDRAGVIEFSVTEIDISNYLEKPIKPDLQSLEAKGSLMAQDFLARAEKTYKYSKPEDLIKPLEDLFRQLSPIGAEFGFRTAQEISRYAGVIEELIKENDTWTADQIIDTAILQKLLPKVHGSRKKIEPVLKILAEYCLIKTEKIKDIWLNPDIEIPYDEVKYPLTLKKLIKMYKRVEQDGFTSFAEA